MKTEFDISRSIIENARGTEKKLRDQEDLLTSLEEKQEFLQEELISLKNQSETAKQEKETVLNQYLSNSCEKSLIDEVQDKYDMITKKVKNTEELLSNVRAKIGEIQTLLPHFVERRDRAVRDIMNSVNYYLQKELREKFEGFHSDIRLAFAANLRAGRNRNFDDFIVGLFQKPERLVFTGEDKKLNEIYERILGEST